MKKSIMVAIIFSMAAAACTSKVAEKPISENSAGIENMKAKEDAKKDLDEKVERSKKIFAQIKRNVSLARNLGQGQTMIELIKIIDSINDQVSDVLPEIDKNKGVASRGQLVVD